MLPVVAIVGAIERARLRAASLVAAAIVLAACSDDDADPGEPRDEPVMDVSTESGDPVCLEVTEELPAEVAELPVIDCAEAHSHEVYATLVYEDDVYPGVDQLSAFASVECLGAFEDFVGRSQFDSSLSYTWLVPTLDGWNDENDREVLCVLADRDREQLVGSMRDANV